MSFSVPIGGTVVTAIALIIFNRKWICKQFSQCCLKLCLCTNNHQEDHLPPAPVLNNETIDDLEEDDLTKHVSNIHTGSEGGFWGWGQNDTSWVSMSHWYKVSKNVFGKALLSLVAEFQN